MLEFRKLLGCLRVVKDASSPRAVAEEMSCVYGRPDLVVGPCLADYWDSTRRDVIGAALSVPALAMVMSLLRPRAPRSLDYLQSSSGLTPNVCRASLNRLVSVEVVHEVRRNAYALADDIPSSQVELWAFEVKLYDLRRASYQAVRNRLFAHRSFIVLPEHVALRNVERLERLKRFDVGVIAVDMAGQRTVEILRARKRKPKSRFQQLAATGRFMRHEVDPI